jgi:hypothetical protein
MWTRSQKSLVDITIQKVALTYRILESEFDTHVAPQWNDVTFNLFAHATHREESYNISNMIYILGIYEYVET